MVFEYLIILDTSLIENRISLAVFLRYPYFIRCRIVNVESIITAYDQPGLIIYGQCIRYFIFFEFGKLFGQ